jgi:hypothetical protein
MEMSMLLNQPKSIIYRILLLNKHRKSFYWEEHPDDKPNQRLLIPVEPLVSR